jgi:hypothetical protein
MLLVFIESIQVVVTIVSIDIIDSMIGWMDGLDRLKCFDGSVSSSLHLLLLLLLLLLPPPPPFVLLRIRISRPKL